MDQAIEFLKANWQWFALAAYLFIEWKLPRTEKVEARSTLELLANILCRVPLVSRLAAAAATPREPKGVEPPPPIRSGEGGFLVVELLLAISLAALVIAACGCACNPAKGKVDGATCARQVLISVDAVNATGTRIARKWISGCNKEARELKQQGQLEASDKKYSACERVADPLARVATGLDDGAETSSHLIDTGEKLGKKEYSGALEPALKAAKEFVKTLADQGIEIPAFVTAFLGVL